MEDSKSKKEQLLDDISHIAALTFVAARAFNLWNGQLENIARELKMRHTYDTKFALKQIESGCKQIEKGLSHFEDWAFNSGITESGHTQDADALDAYLSDGSFFAVLLAHVFNASIDDNESRSQIESLLKEMANKDIKISYDVIDKVRMK